MLFMFSLLLLLSFASAAPRVQLGNTTLTGEDLTLSNQEFFGGIPFAESPVGALRLETPVLKANLNITVFDARNFGLSCLQPGVPADSVSEDCLTINVLRPAGLSPNTLLPVMTWIYGGGFLEGSASAFNGSAIVSQSVERGTPVIFVNFNYRLGPLGFPQGHEAEDKGALNLGLKDQLIALQWIQQNIAAFGGDKTKVTVFGESAGASSIAIHYMDINFGSLVRAAIMESGTAATLSVFNASRRESDWTNFIMAVPQCAAAAGGSDTITCLQSVTNTTILLQALAASTGEANEQAVWEPVLDGTDGVYPDHASTLIGKGHFARIPFIIGTNLDEGSAFTSPTVNYTADIVRTSLLANFTPSPMGPAALDAAVTTLMQLYPDTPALGSPIGTGNATFGLSPEYKRISMIHNDVFFQSQRRSWIQAASSAGVDAFGYLFTDPQPQNAAFLGVSHASELPYVFGGLPDTAPPASRNLSRAMIDYWVAFATGLSPNDGCGVQRPQWPQYTQSNHMLLQLDGGNTTAITDDYRAEQIDYIASVAAVYSQ